MANFNRRQFLQLGAAGIALGSSVPFLRNPIFRRALHAAECDLLPAKKMLVIWQRGGNDGLNTVIPYGDNSYNTVNRPTLFVDPLDAIDLNGFCALHPSLAKLHEVYLSGDLAIMHRVGYDGQSRSHFTSQHYWENGEPGSIENLTGMVNNLITEDPLLADHALPAASVSYQYQQLFQGPRVLSHIADLRSYTLGTDPDDLKLIGALPGLAGDGSGVLGIYSQPGNGQVYNGMIKSTGLTMAAGIDHLACRGVDANAYVPYGTATYPTASGDDPDFTSGTSFNFFRHVQQAVQLLKETDVRVVGVELGGWDTHSNQGLLEGNHPTRLHEIAHAMRSISVDLQDPSRNIWDDTIVLTNTEFGRTSKENDSEGTDHAESSVVFVAGGAVNGGLWNCDGLTWADGDILAIDEKYLPHQTDFRAIFGEIVGDHFGMAGSLDAIIPGYSSLGLSYPGIIA